VPQPFAPRTEPLSPPPTLPPTPQHPAFYPSRPHPNTEADPQPPPHPPPHTAFSPPGATNTPHPADPTSTPDHRAHRPHTPNHLPTNPHNPNPTRNRSTRRPTNHTTPPHPNPKPPPPPPTHKPTPSSIYYPTPHHPPPPAQPHPPIHTHPPVSNYRPTANNPPKCPPPPTPEPPPPPVPHAPPSQTTQKTPKPLPHHPATRPNSAAPPRPDVPRAPPLTPASPCYSETFSPLMLCIPANTPTIPPPPPERETRQHMVPQPPTTPPPTDRHCCDNNKTPHYTRPHKATRPTPDRKKPPPRLPQYPIGPGVSRLSVCGSFSHHCPCPRPLRWSHYFGENADVGPGVAPDSTAPHPIFLRARTWRSGGVRSPHPRMFTASSLLPRSGSTIFAGLPWFGQRAQNARNRFDHGFPPQNWEPSAPGHPPFLICQGQLEGQGDGVPPPTCRARHLANPSPGAGISYRGSPKTPLVTGAGPLPLRTNTHRASGTKPPAPAPHPAPLQQSA